MRRLGLYLLYGWIILSLKNVFPLPGDFLMLAVIFFGFYEHFWIGLFLSLVFGFLLDVVSFSPLGVTVFSYGLLFFFIRFFRSKIVFRSLISRFFWLLVFSGAGGVLRWGFAYLMEESYRPLFIFLPGILATAVFGLFWIPFLEWLQGLAAKDLVASQELLLHKGSAHGTYTGLLSGN